MRERAEDLHHRSVATERKHRVVLMRVVLGDSPRMSGRFSQHEVTIDTGVGERLQGSPPDALSAARCRINNQKYALNSSRRESHCCRGAHAVDSKIRTLLVLCRGNSTERVRVVGGTDPSLSIHYAPTFLSASQATINCSYP